MRKIAFAIALFLSFTLPSGCAFWSSNVDTVIKRANSTATYFWELALPMANQMCQQRAQSCIDAGIKSADQCKPWVDCREMRRALSLALQSMHMALYEAEVALSLGKEDEASKMAEIAMKEIAVIHLMLKEMGIF